MSNYQYENSNINQFMTNLLWGLFIIHAKLQIWFGKVYDNFFYPVYMSLEKILGLDDETYNDDVAINTVVKSSVKFLSVMLQYKENETEKKEIEINIDPSEYIVGAKLFTSSWITEYIENNNLNQLPDNKYNILFIDNDINRQILDNEKYVILDTNNYIIKTI